MRVGRTGGVPGFTGFLTEGIPGVSGRKQVCKPHSGVIDDQLMEQRPTYRAGFALDITLNRSHDFW
jgi:hypothetical protein